MIISKINHSCVPNCIVTMNSRQANVFALRDIEENEELTISYVDALLPRDLRQCVDLDDILELNSHIH